MSERVSEQDIFPEETCRILTALAKKKNRHALTLLVNGSIKDEQADIELLKTMHNLISSGMVSHKADVGITKDNQLVVANGFYEISELGKAVLVSLSKIWSVNCDCS